MTVRRAVMFVEPVGIDQRIGNRKRNRALVVVDDNYVDTGTACHRQRIERLSTTIDGDDQRASARGEPDQRLPRWPVPFHQPVGDVNVGLEAELTQQPNHQGCGGSTVDVVIAEDRYPLLAGHCIGKAVGRAVHVAED